MVINTRKSSDMAVHEEAREQIVRQMEVILDDGWQGFWVGRKWVHILRNVPLRCD